MSKEIKVQRTKVGSIVRCCIDSTYDPRFPNRIGMLAHAFDYTDTVAEVHPTKGILLEPIPHGPIGVWCKSWIVVKS